MNKEKLKDPLPDCSLCGGNGHKYVDCGNELSGFDYRYPCACRMRSDDYDKECKEQELKT